MRQEINVNGTIFKVGDLVFIEKMKGESQYNNKSGYITLIDDADQIHGTWGGCALVPDLDKFKKIDNSL